MPNSVVIWLRLETSLGKRGTKPYSSKTRRVFRRGPPGFAAPPRRPRGTPLKGRRGGVFKIRKRQVTPQAARNRGLRTFRRRERSVRACGLGGRAAGWSSAGRCVPGRLGSDGLMRRNDGHAGALSAWCARQFHVREG